MSYTMSTRHAVLYYPDCPFPNSALVWIEERSNQKKLHREELAEPCYTLTHTAEMCYSRHISHLWVDPAYGLFPVEENREGWTFHYQKRNGNAASVSVWQRGHARPVNILFPQFTGWYGSASAPGWMYGKLPHNIIITLHYLEKELGVPIGGSPGRVGWAYLKELRAAPGWTEAIPGVDWKAMHFESKAATDLIWHRPLKQSERESPVTLYLQKYDEAAAYPYAASQTDMGVGEPLHMDARDAHIASLHEKGSPQSVGVWRCTINYDASRYNPLMPPVWKEELGTYAGSEGWIAGPIIRLLRSQGHEVIVHEGYIFPERHDVLKRWAENLWAIREGYKITACWKNVHCAGLASRAVKTIMNTMIGMTAFKRFEEDDEMRRPDIRIQTIARHRELTYHRLQKVEKLYGVTPVLVYMDALYYLTHEPDGRAALPELVKREGQFGGYRWEGAIKADGTVLALLECMKNEATILQELNTIGWRFDL